jgi:hypothetical protein
MVRLPGDWQEPIGRLGRALGQPYWHNNLQQGRRGPWPGLCPTLRHPPHCRFPRPQHPSWLLPAGPLALSTILVCMYITGASKNTVLGTALVLRIQTAD